MGYPMTYQRFIRRNHLDEGDYDHDPRGVPVASAPFPGPDRFNEGVDYMGVVMDEMERRKEEIERLCSGRRLMLADLRRLERDTQDEDATCRELARQTAIDPEIVAAVLRAWVSW